MSKPRSCSHQCGVFKPVVVLGPRFKRKPTALPDASVWGRDTYNPHRLRLSASFSLSGELTIGFMDLKSENLKGFGASFQVRWVRAFGFPGQSRTQLLDTTWIRRYACGLVPGIASTPTSHFFSLVQTNSFDSQSSEVRQFIPGCFFSNRELRLLLISSGGTTPPHGGRGCLCGF